MFRDLFGFSLFVLFCLFVSCLLVSWQQIVAKLESSGEDRVIDEEGLGAVELTAVWVLGSCLQAEGKLFRVKNCLPSVENEDL